MKIGNLNKLKKEILREAESSNKINLLIDDIKEKTDEELRNVKSMYHWKLDDFNWSMSHFDKEIRICASLVYYVYDNCCGKNFVELTKKFEIEFYEKDFEKEVEKFLKNIIEWAKTHKYENTYGKV